MRNDSSYENALQRIRQVQSELETTSDATSQIIHQQGEDVDRIAHSSSRVEHNVSLSSRLVRGLESFSGRVANFFSSPPQPPKTLVNNPTASSSHSTSQPNSSEDPLDSISLSLGRLKEKSTRISQEIERQNASLEKSSTSVEGSVSTLRAQHKKIIGLSHFFEITIHER
jgi:hypothetical protein